MLFLARADHAQIALARQNLDAREEMQRIAEYFEGVAEEKGVQCKVEVEDDPTVWADPVLFRRAVNNLMANAIRYTPKGGTIHLHVTPTAEGQSISVINPGPGIDEEHLSHIFDRFYRVDHARSESASSAGLGLAIVHTIMKLHGGRAEVESEPNRLTCFKLFFPKEHVAVPVSRHLAKNAPEHAEMARNGAWDS